MAQRCQTSISVAGVRVTRALAKRDQHLPSLTRQEFRGTQVLDLNRFGRGVSDRALAK